MCKSFVRLIAVCLLFALSVKCARKANTRRSNDLWYMEDYVPVPARPYEFGYKIRAKDGVDQYRKESSDGRRVTGSYGYWAPDGLYRHVHYVADENGYRASIRTSEPGTSNDSPAAVQIMSDPVNNLLIPSGLEPVTSPLTKTYDSPTTFRISSYPVDTTPTLPRMMPTVEPTETIETPEEIMNMILRQPNQTPLQSPKTNYNPRPTKSYDRPKDTYVPRGNPYDRPSKTYEPPGKSYEPPTNIYNPPNKNYNPPCTLGISSYPTDPTPTAQRPMPHMPQVDTYVPRGNPYDRPSKTYEPPGKSYEPPTNIYNPPNKNYNPPSTLGISSYPTDPTPTAQRPMPHMPQVGYDTDVYDSTPLPTSAPTMPAPSSAPSAASPPIVYITGPPIPKQGTKSPLPPPSVMPSVVPPPAPPSAKYLPQPTGTPMQGSAYVAPIGINLPLGNNHDNGINYNTGHSIAKKRYCECRETEEISKRSDEEEPVTDNKNSETTEAPIK